jgi:ABC-type polysaccharide/polyol phosphate export permease
MRSLWLHQGTINRSFLAISIASSIILLLVGYRYFKSKEREFADII